jgi:hypothetical protein
MRVALAIVTDFVAGGPDRRPTMAGSELERVVLNDEISDADLVVALGNIITTLLVKLENLGQPIPDVLADMGRKLA